MTGSVTLRTSLRLKRRSSSEDKKLWPTRGHTILIASAPDTLLYPLFGHPPLRPDNPSGHLFIYRFRCRTFFTASTIAAVSILYFCNNCAGSPDSPNEFFMPTNSIGTG